MKFSFVSSDDPNIVIFNAKDETPILIIEPDSFEYVDGEIKIIVDNENDLNKLKAMIGL